LHVLRQIPGVADVQPTADGCDVHLLPGADPAAAMQQIAAQVRVVRLAMARLRLEDVFLRLVAADARNPEVERALRENLQGVATEGALT
jgi:hypothetical protein